MTDRKPPGVRWETFVERQIREAMERGEFDNLPSAGKPLPDLDQPYDELWWVRKKLREEKITHLPAVLLLRKEIEDAQERIDRAATEDQVRRAVEAINARIVEVNRTQWDGPASNFLPLDVEATLAAWRALRQAPPPAAS